MRSKHLVLILLVLASQAVRAEDCPSGLLAAVERLKALGRPTSTLLLNGWMDSCDDLEIKPLAPPVTAGDHKLIAPGVYALSRGLARREHATFAINVPAGQLLTLEAVIVDAPKGSSASMSNISFQLTPPGGTTRRATLSRRLPWAELRAIATGSGAMQFQLGSDLSMTPARVLLSAQLSPLADGAGAGDSSAQQAAQWHTGFQGHLGLEDQRDVIELAGEYSGKTITVTTSDAGFGFTLGSYGDDRQLVDSAKGTGEASVTLPRAQRILLAIKDASAIDANRPRYRDRRRHTSYRVALSEATVPEPAISGREDYLEVSETLRTRPFASDREARAAFAAEFLKRPDSRWQPFEFKPDTRQSLLGGIEATFFSKAEQTEEFEYHDSDLSRLSAEWELLTAAQQQRYRSLILPPNDPASYFHPKNLDWQSHLPKLSPRSSQTSQWPHWIGLFLGSSSAYAANITEIQFDPDDISPGSYVTWHSAVYDNLMVHIPQNVLAALSGNFSEELEQSLNDHLLDIGAKVLTAAEQALPNQLDFFGINISQLDLPLEFWVVGDMYSGHVSGANGLHYNCQQMYISAWAEKTDGTTAHELFHCFQKSLGMMGMTGIFDEKWMIEGGAKLGEHIGLPQRDTEHSWYPPYAKNPDISLFSKTYSAALGWFAMYMRPDMGPGYVRDQFLYYANTMNRSAHAGRLRPHWHDLALDLSNSSIVYASNEGVVPTDSGVPIDLSMVKVKEVQIGSMEAQLFEAELQAMSASYMDIQLAAGVRSKLDYVRFSLGDEIPAQDPDLEISVAILTATGVSFHEVELDTDEHGIVYFLICVKSNTVCDKAEETRIYEGLVSMFITITNSAPQKSLSILGLIEPFGPNQYKLQKVHFNDETLRVPASGGSTLSIDLDNETEEDRGIYTAANNAWMKFDSQFYDWDALESPQTNPQVDVHPTRLTGYVNAQCRFRGHMGYDIEDSSSEELEAGWIRRTFKIKRKTGDDGSGDFYKTKHRFVCGKAKAGTDLGVAGMPFYAAYAKMLAAINTTDYAEDSFAMKLRSIFAQTISLGLIDNSSSDQEGEVAIEFQSDQLLRIKYSDNLVLYYVKE